MRSKIRSLLGSYVPLFALLALVGMGGGCGGRAEKPSSTDRGPKRPAAVNRKGCNDLLETALATLQPDQYQVGDTSGALTLLGSWKLDCTSAEILATTEAMIGDRTRARLTDEILARVQSTEYTDRDATHIRTSLLFRDVAVAATGDAEDELDKVVNVFGFVVRNVQLLEDDAPLAGIGAFQSLLFGEGSARDRAWIFAALLRQLRIDAVILRPNGSPEEPAPMAADAKPDAKPATAADRWLIGVLLNGECYLFDSRLGIPVPAASDDGLTAIPERPATLAEVRGEGQLLDRLDIEDRPYPLDDADLDDLRVEVVGNSSGWAPRLVGLQGILTGRRSVLLVDSFDDEGGRLGHLGIVERLTTQGGQWTADDIGVWPYPESRLQITLDVLPAATRSEILARSEVFTSVLRDGRRLLLYGRLQHLRGHCNQAADGISAGTAYTGVRDVGAGASDLQQESARDAQFWIALCALESGDRDTAESGLRAYVLPPWDGRFERSAHLAIALGRARRGSTARAIAELEEISPNGPDAPLIAYLEQRWSTASPEPDADGGDAPESVESESNESTPDSTDGEPGREPPTGESPSEGRPADETPAAEDPNEAGTNDVRDVPE